MHTALSIPSDEFWNALGLYIIFYFGLLYLLLSGWYRQRRDGVVTRKRVVMCKGGLFAKVQSRHLTIRHLRLDSRVATTMHACLESFMNPFGVLNHPRGPHATLFLGLYATPRTLS